MVKEDYTKFSFVKQYTSSLGSTNMLFQVHKGFDNIVDLKKLLIEKRIDVQYVVIVKYLDMYYGIIFEDYNRSYIIGKLRTYYVNDNYIQIGCNTETFTPKFYPTFVKKQVYKHQTLAYDLKHTDSNIDVYLKDRSIAKFEYSNTYVVILALTFVEHYFSYNEIYILSNYYFSQDYSDCFTSKIVGINPFKGKVIRKDGGIRNYQFYEGYTPYYARKHNKECYVPDLEINYINKTFYTTIDEENIFGYYSAREIFSTKKEIEVTKQSNVIYLKDYFK